MIQLILSYVYWYITAEQVAKEAAALGKGRLIVKIDIKAAYCLIPVAPEDRLCLDMKWEDKVYIDVMLPFGLRSAPKFFNAIADPLKWCVIKERGEYHISLLKWYYTIGTSLLWGVWYQSPNTEVNLWRPRSSSSSRKQAGPSTCIELLGIIIDSVKQELWLSRNKLDRLLRVVQQWHACKSCTKRTRVSIREPALCLHSSSPGMLISPTGHHPTKCI